MVTSSVPPAPPARRSVDLVEREEDLAVLRLCYTELEVNRVGGVVLIEGPPGIGKSSLLDASLSAAPATLRVLRACASELEGVLSFGAVRQLFGPLMASLDAESRERVFDGPAGLARPVLLPSLGESGSPGDPLYGLYWLTMALAEEAPLVLALDDVHWIDEESARFLAYLTDRLDGTPVLIVAAERPNEPGQPRELLDRVRSRATVVRPAPLSPAGVETLLRRASPAVYTATGGNPLLVVELMRSLALAPDLSVEDAGPPTVARLVLERVSRVSEDALALARAACLFAGGVSLHEAAEVARLGPDRAAAAADDLAAIEVFAPDEPLRFVHPVVRRAVYDQLGPFGRRRGHTRAAEVLTAAGAPPEAIAAHLLACSPRHDPSSMQVLVAAAEGAQRRNSLGAAARYVERALAERAAAPAEQARLATWRGSLLAALGRADALDVFHDAAMAAPDAEVRADLAIQAGIVAAVHPEQVNRIVELLEDVRARAGLDRMRGLAIDALIAGLRVTQGDPAGFAMLGDLPEDLSGTTVLERLILSVVALHRCLTGSPVSQVIDLVRRSLPVLEGIDLGTDADDSSFLFVTCGALADAEAYARKRMEHARRTGSEAGHIAALIVRNEATLTRGDLLSVEADARLALESDTTQPRPAAYLRQQLHRVLIAQGDLAGAEAVAAELSDVEGFASFAQARAAAAVGDSGRVVTLLRPWRQAMLERGYVVPPMSYAELLVDALAASGSRDEALATVAEHRVAADSFGEVRQIAKGHLLAGRHNCDSSSREHLEEAFRLLDPSPFRWDAALARLELATALRRAGERATARTMLMPALDYAESQRAVPLAGRVREELAMCGARPRKAMVRGADALTPAEARIARLAADGLQNKEIAQQLFLTIGTVQTTLVRVYRKLDVGSRREIAAALDAADGTRSAPGRERTSAESAQRGSR